MPFMATFLSPSSVFPFSVAWQLLATSPFGIRKLMSLPTILGGEETLNKTVWRSGRHRLGSHRL